MSTLHYGYRHKIDLYRPKSISDGAGGFQITPTLYHQNFICRISALPDKQARELFGDCSRERHVVTLRKWEDEIDRDYFIKHSPNTFASPLRETKYYRVIQPPRKRQLFTGNKHHTAFIVELEDAQT